MLLDLTNDILEFAIPVCKSKGFITRDCNPLSDEITNPVVTSPKSVEEIVATVFSPVLEFLTNPVELSPRSDELTDELISKTLSFVFTNPLVFIFKTFK